MSEDWHIVPNPWTAWREARRNWERWQYMHQLHGAYGGDQPCRGCVHVSATQFRREFVEYYRDDCDVFPAGLDRMSGRYWHLDWPACRLYREREEKS